MLQYSIFPQQRDVAPSPEPESTIDTLSERLASYLTADQIEQVRSAYFFAAVAHEGQLRHSGEPYVTHPLAVAGVLADMHMDHQSLMAAMLHDVIEDTWATKEQLAEQFGEEVAELVDGVSKLTQIEFRSKAEAQAENFQKMALAMARDIRVILVKLADRLHNMRTLGVLKPEKRRRIAKETLEIYAPIAQRLGMHNLRVEFEDLGFAALYPMRADRIRAALRASHGNRRETLERIRSSIEEFLREEGHDARVIGREKHLYSIYKKMRTKRKSLSEIMDIYAVRIIVDTVDTCYRVLGCVHGLYKPVPGQFKDYIAIPKANGYQSLHTVLIGRQGVPIEVQIRTEEMEEMASNGIAAHWLYKNNSGQPESGSHARARRWVQGLLEMQQQAGDSLEFIENVKIDLFPDEVYVFTPKGEIMELPQGATAVDFAYSVHTDVGNSCVACRINRRLAPLSEPLQSGQTVEVITAPGAQPNPAWLNFVVTAKARTTVRHFLKHRRKAEAVQLGRRLLDKALNSFDSNIDALTDEQKEHVLRETGADSLEQLMEEIGLGTRVSFITARQLLSVTDKAAQAGLPTKRSKANDPLVIQGTEGVVVSFARCCYPLPGDPIAGAISAEKGIVVHIESCHNIVDLRSKPERFVPLRWADNLEGEFAAELRIEVEKTRGLLAVLATRIADSEASVKKMHVDEESFRFSAVHLVLGVRNRIHLARVIKRLRTVKSVTRVTRVRR
ncbi:MAG: bifunctional GTP diphosphokinase/guanosine-3',5'-bis pyrophosphate 3'-pyrophosphohydrolase [Spongiibacteraceae bacterium]|jgi:RelA/SpoT family (p)ppGpp synthetase|nr:bifunctional GTP diphosphokinase/guanosine-3',5'-bis pyrophosphate 3'-pyrophosphohydrolase [Spongiibacteraceae bacterium]